MNMKHSIDLTKGEDKMEEDSIEMIEISYLGGFEMMVSIMTARECIFTQNVMTASIVVFIEMSKETRSLNLQLQTISTMSEKGIVGMYWLYSMKDSKECTTLQSNREHETLGK